MVHCLLQHGLEISRIERKLDRFSRMHLSRNQGKDDRLLHLVTGLHWSRIEPELQKLLELIGRDPIDTLDGVDCQDYPRAFPAERHVESFLGVEYDGILSKVRVGARDHPAIYVLGILPERVLDPEPASLKIAELDDHIRSSLIARVAMGLRLLIVEDGE